MVVLRFLPVLFLTVSMLLSACSVPFVSESAPTAEPDSTPTDEDVSEPDATPTPAELDETLLLESVGVSLDYPADWATRATTRTVTLAASSASLDAANPGEDLVVLVDVQQVSALAAQYGEDEVEDLEGLFEVSSTGPLEAGYTVEEPAELEIDGQSALSAEMRANGGAGQLVVVSVPPHVVRVLGQAAPAAWESQQATFEAIVESLSFAEPVAEATAEPAEEAAQPLLVSEGPDNFVLRLGGNTGPAEGRFVSVRGLAADESGTLYVAESGRGIWVFESDGTLARVFGEDDLLDAQDIALGPGGDLFVADSGHNAILRFTPAGELEQRWGQTGDQPDQFGLLAPQRLATGADGSVYALDSKVAADSSVTNSVLHFSAEGAFIERIDLAAGLSPNDLAVDQEGNIYLADSGGGSIVKLNAQGQELTRIGQGLDEDGISAGAVALDEQGNIFVAAWGRGVLKFAPDGTLLTTVGAVAEPGTTPQPGEFSLPNGITTAPGEIVWVSDNDGEYSAITALRIVPEVVQQATEPGADTETETQPEATATPIPEDVLVNQWASDASASTEYDDEYAADGATGEPDVETCTSNPDAWAPAAPGTEETLELEFDEEVFATGINVYESHQPGSITEIEIIDILGDATTVYTGTSQLLLAECPNVLSVEFEPLLDPVRRVRLTLDQSAENNWSEIDAVELVGLQ
jgi:sugar lactone lactonase YvrE